MPPQLSAVWIASVIISPQDSFRRMRAGRTVSRAKFARSAGSLIEANRPMAWSSAPHAQPALPVARRYWKYPSHFSNRAF